MGCGVVGEEMQMKHSGARVSLRCGHSEIYQWRELIVFGVFSLKYFQSRCCLYH